MTEVPGTTKPAGATCEVLAERVVNNGKVLIHVWVTPTGENRWATMGALNTVTADSMQHVRQVKPVTDSAGAHMVFTLCSGHGSKEIAQAVTDHLAERLELTITATRFVNSAGVTPEEARAATTRLITGLNEFGKLAGDVLGTLIQPARRRDW